MVRPIFIPTSSISKCLPSFVMWDICVVTCAECIRCLLLDYPFHLMLHSSPCMYIRFNHLCDVLFFAIHPSSAFAAMFNEGTGLFEVGKVEDEQSHLMNQSPRLADVWQGSCK